MDIIHHSRKSLLFSDDKAWMKKEGSGLFDVAIESYDGAKVCELVGMFALSRLPMQYNKYRDDGLAVFRAMSGSMADRARKDIVKFFKDIGLRIIPSKHILRLSTFSTYH